MTCALPCLQPAGGLCAPLLEQWQQLQQQAAAQQSQGAQLSEHSAQLKEHAVQLRDCLRRGVGGD